jgi:phytoene dehydrogenase-like protein
VLADVGAPALFEHLLEARHVPERVRQAIGRFQYDNATFKVDWALAGPVPWPSEPARRAGTIHVTEGLDALTRASTELTLGQVPAEPFIIGGQYAAADPTRQPPGTETFWSYTHVPQAVRGDAGGDGLTGAWGPEEAQRFADRMEDQLEAVAPGFRALVRARSVTTPHELEAADANLVRGALNGGTAQLHQQLVFRPVPGLGRAETPVAGLYLASASAHPGGGVHGGPGAIAARAARREAGGLRHVAARAAGAAVGRGRP